MMIRGFRTHGGPESIMNDSQATGFLRDKTKHPSFGIPTVQSWQTSGIIHRKGA